MPCTFSAQESEGLVGKESFWILAGLLFISVCAYLPLAHHNLPVTTNPDDRTALGVLLRFTHGSANPRFFMYPSLYFYFTYLLTAGFGVSHLLLSGHVLNLCLLGVTAWLGYVFCQRHFYSRGAGLLAACCIVLSPTLLASAAYLDTDILLAGLTLLSLDRLLTYCASGSFKDWLFAILAIAFTFATKYTAAILLITYCVVELVRVSPLGNLQRNQKVPGREKAEHFSKRTMSLLCLSVSVVCLLGAIFFPVARVLRFVATHRTNLDARTQATYLDFLHHLRLLGFKAAAASALLLAAILVFRPLFEALSYKRLYWAGLLVLSVFVLTTPYSLLDPGKFAYDIGALLHSNVVVAGTHQQWASYARWLLFDENPAAIAVGLVGLGLLISRAPRRFLALAVYVILYATVVCTSHLGVQRYLTPLIPVIYCGTGLLLIEIWKRLALQHSLAWRGALCLAGLALLVQMVVTVRRPVRLSAEHDVQYASYQRIVGLHQSSTSTGTVYYAGYVPSVELELQGIATQPVAWTKLSTLPIESLLSCSDLLLVSNREAALNHIKPEQDQTGVLLMEDTRGIGQTLLKRRGCP